MTRFFCFLALLGCCIGNSLFSQPISLIGGLNYGGPLPTKMSDSLFGHPVPGIHAGLACEIDFSEKWSVQPELYYSFRGADYGQVFRKDTLVSIVILGVPGQVPSFYTAFVDGSMRLHYIDLPVMAVYKMGKLKVLAGLHVSHLLKCRDNGSVRVQVGEGGFYDDYTTVYNNKNMIRKWDYGVIIGASTLLYRKMYSEVKVSRSFCSLYKQGFMESKGNGENRIYHTFLHISLGYKIS